MLTENIIKQSLSHIIEPISGENLNESGLLSAITIKGANVGVMLTISPEHKESQIALKPQIEQAIAEINGVEKVTVVMTSQQEAAIDSSTIHAAAVRGKPLWIKTPLPHVKKVIAVASGKGGVGKSSVTILLARHLQKQGLRVGIVDVDIYGPSIPFLLGLQNAPAPELAGGLMIPHNADGIAVNSLGFLVKPEQAAIMRGAMASKTLYQLIRGTMWGIAELPLDVLLVDTPPGTGDVHLSLIQQVPLSHNGGGAIIVTTPHELALLDARKALAMFNKLEVPILGVIENMSYLQQNDARINIFGQGAGADLANDAGATLLAQIPINPNILQQGYDFEGLGFRV
jgi:ATP-binding protein involved in chromosome partitioning